VLTVNLAVLGDADASLSLGSFFTLPELLVLFLVGPLFLTRVGHLLAIASVVYCMQKLLGQTLTSPSLALYLVIGAATIVAVLGDKMPWLAAEGPNRLAQMIREALLFVLTTGALCAVFTGIVRVHGFAHWLSHALALQIPALFLLVLLLTLLGGWASIALGYTRHFTLPLLSLPSLFVVAFATAWPSDVLLVPFALSLALSLATADRRAQSHRRGAALGWAKASR